MNTILLPNQDNQEQHPRIRMFEGKSEKGLFTFYWEEGQNWTSRQTPVDIQLHTPDIITPLQDQMEEIHIINKHQKNPVLRWSNSLGQLVSIHITKQNKATLKPKYVNLSPKIDEKCIIKFVVAKKRKKNQLTDRSNLSLQLPQLVQHERVSTVRKDILCDNFPIQQKNINCRPINIQLPIKGKENGCKFNKLNPMKKLNKFTIQTISKKQSRSSKTDKLPSINGQIYEPHLKLPSIGRKPTKKKTDSPKQPFSLEQLMLEQELMMSCSTVINLGQICGDEHLSWRLRKQQFLQQLNSSSLHS